MTEQTRQLRIQRTLNAAPAEVYRAFTHTTALRDWLADTAFAAAHVGGHIFLRWKGGYWAAGEFTALEPGKAVAFTWHGSGDPGPTRVRVSLAPRGSRTALTLTHAGLGAGKKWAAAEAQIRRGWESGLENLGSVLETGIDLRQARLPRLGIYIGDFDAATAARLGVPVSQGVRLEGVAPESGAAAAGLQKDDVVVGFGGARVTHFDSLGPLLQGKQAGDSLPVVYYRGAKKHTVTLTLSARPAAPELPASGAALAEIARGHHKALLKDFTARLRGVSEAEAERKPAPGAWNVKELLAHFIASERDLQSWIADMLNDHTVPDSLEYRPNADVRLQAIVARLGSLAGLLRELKASCAETAAMLEALPPEFVARRHMLQRAAYWIMFVTPSHLPDEHGEQLTAAVAAARQ